MIFLLGASGYIGQAYEAFFKARGIPFRSLSRRELDYTRPALLEKELREYRPDFLINAAGFTGKPNVDACEYQKTECLAGNAVLPGLIAQACASANIPWAHLSSGCIFTGSHENGQGFSETDVPNFSFRTNNCSFYSGCKALGEEAIADSPSCYVWRIRIPFSRQNNPRNYITKLLTYPRLLSATNSLSSIEEFIPASLEIWQRQLPFGIYHLTNPGAITTEEVVELIRKSGITQKTFEFFKDEEEFLRVAAKTPRSNCVLDTSKLESAGIRMTEIHAAVKQALADWRQ